MKIGIVTDTHDDVERLTAALAALRAESVDVIVSLGDTTDFHGARNRAWEVARTLRDAGAVGVWGNHDFGLCRDVPLDVIENPDADALAYFATFQPRLVLGGCHFSHVEPWLDPTNPLDLWYFDGRPDSAEKLARSFAAVPEGVCFVGHFHTWMVGNAAGMVSWNAAEPLHLPADGRHLVVVGPLFDGCYAMFDTDTRTLHPRRLP